MTGTLQACLVRNQADECRPCTIISSAIRCASGGVAEAISVRKWVELPRPPGQEFAQIANISQQIREFKGRFRRLAILACDSVTGHHCRPSMRSQMPLALDSELLEAPPWRGS